MGSIILFQPTYVPICEERDSEQLMYIRVWCQQNNKDLCRQQVVVVPVAMNVKLVGYCSRNNTYLRTESL
jgi:hypothetical protein